MENNKDIGKWMKTVDKIADHSTCASGRKIGSLVVVKNSLLVTGSNGYPIGYPNPNICNRREKNIESGESLELCVCVHSEANCIATAARYGIRLDGATIYCSVQPCTICSGLIANSGIKKVVFKKEYPKTKCKEICDYAKIEVVKYDK